jgi:hypothetical protein
LNQKSCSRPQNLKERKKSRLQCHKSKNLVPMAGGIASRTGAAVVELQQRVPNARVLFSHGRHCHWLPLTVIP